MFSNFKLLRPAKTVRLVSHIAMAAALLLLVQACATRPAPPAPQAGGYSAEIAKIEMTDKRVTLKASMGQQTLRVAPGVALDAFKPGDKVLITFGQEGAEPIITRIDWLRP